MALTVNTNQRSQNALGAVRKNQEALSKSFQRLSSALRINTAADDAAGLAISSRFNSQIRGLNQAIRNASDGVSYTQVADAALSSTNENLQRIRELSIQAANGTLTDSDRGAIQAEIDQLSDEIGRIGDTTTFNGKPVLDGSLNSGRIQVGANPNEAVALPSLDARSSTLGQAAELTTGPIAPNGLAAGDLQLNGVDIRATSAADDTLSTANAAGSAIAVAAAVNDQAGATGVRATVNATEVDAVGDVQGGQLDSGNQLIINGQAIVAVNVQAGDAGDGLMDAINAAADETGVVAARGADGQLELTAQDGRNIDVQLTGNAGQITGLAAGVTTGTVTLTSDQQFAVAGNAPANAGAQGGIVGINVNENIDNVDATTVVGANAAIETVDRAIAQVGRQRSSLGALQNRFQSTISNLSNVAENASAANSRISDADFASEAATLVRNQILSQANISVLSQANVSNQLALQLLG